VCEGTGAGEPVGSGSATVRGARLDVQAPANPTARAATTAIENEGERRALCGVAITLSSCGADAKAGESA